MTMECAYPSCATKRGCYTQRSKSWHRIPLEEELRKLWLAALRMSPNTTAEQCKGLLVCSDHFEPEDFRKKEEATSVAPLQKRSGLRQQPRKEKKSIERTRLKSHAVPRTSTVEILWSPQNHPDPSRPVSVKQEEPEDQPDLNQSVESRLQVQMNSPDSARDISIKLEEPEDHAHLSNIPYLSPLLANMNPVVVLHELPLNMVRQVLHPPAHLQQCSSDEEENVNHSGTCWEPKDDRGNDSNSDWWHSKSRSNRKKQKKGVKFQFSQSQTLSCPYKRVSVRFYSSGRKLNKDVTSMTQTSQANTNDILHMVVCKEEVSPEQEWSPSLLQEEPEPPHIKEEQEELLQRIEEPDGSMLTLLAVKSEVDDEHISSHCYEIEVKLEPDTEVTEDGDDLEETSGGVRSHSSQIQSFSCSECPCAFTSQICLHEHIRRKHTKKTFHCNQCNKSFGEPGALKRHQFVHNGEKPFLCKQCYKSYTHSDGLKIHHLVTGHGERPFRCTQCRKGFDVPCALKIHQLVHTGEKLKPFHCKDCDQGWTGHLAYRTFAQSAEPLMVEESKMVKL